MSYKNIIRSNTDLIVALRQQIGETGAKRDESEERWQQWVSACSEFRARYSQLAFLGGVETARERLRSGDSASIDYALDFLELRPFFFRSGYMYNDFMRVLRNCPMSDEQTQRYKAIRERYEQYRKQRHDSNASA